MTPDLPAPKNPDRADCGAGAGAGASPLAFPVDELEATIAAFRDPQRATETETRLLWLRVFEAVEELELQGADARQVKREAMAWLARRAGFLAPTRNALKVAWNRRHARWLQGERKPTAIADGRRLNAPVNRKFDLRPEDRDAIVSLAVLKHGGRLAPAYREARARGMLSEQLLGRNIENPSRKTYVPEAIRAACTSEVGMLYDIHHGPRQHRLNGAYIARDWSAVKAGDWYQADDVTFPVYFWVRDPQSGFRLTRGQCLVFIDLRSTRVLGYSLIPERQYNAHAIRATITRVCDTHGLPRKGFYFERGIWESSRLLKGQQNDDENSWSETETGLREIGVRFVHARLPRSKPVERVLGLIQDRMEGERGYVGRNEMVEKFEHVQRAILAVGRGAESPEAHFMSFEQWDARLAELCAEYNAERQDGKMTGGLSPEDAFREYDDPQNPQTRLDARCRFLLANHKRPTRVTKNGIVLRFGKQTFVYRGEETAPLVGQLVLAWFNPESPDVLAVTDMNRRNPFTVARANEVPAMGATDAELRAAHEQVAAHNAYAKTRYRVLEAQFQKRFRTNLVDGETAQLGRAIVEKESEARIAHARESGRERAVCATARELGMAVRPEMLRRPDTADALGELSQLLADAREEISMEGGSK